MTAVIKKKKVSEVKGRAYSVLAQQTQCPTSKIWYSQVSFQVNGLLLQLCQIEL